MPHSVSPEDSSIPDQDAMNAEPETINEEVRTIESTLVANPGSSNGNSQESDAADQDMTMGEVDQEKEAKVAVKEEFKPEVKLEDLFADIESDEEFPSSTSQDIKVSSSPQAPASPM
jgi:DNA primase small subunit